MSRMMSLLTYSESVGTGGWIPFRAMGVCVACGSVLRTGSGFCSLCGVPVPVPCPACGSTVEEGDSYCATCGGRLASRAATRERRRVSVLFCDLVGYTRLVDRRDPEDARELLSGYFDLARAIVERYDGVVEKYAGDAVMAVWGSPRAHEDDAERAVRAGLELAEAIPPYGESAGLDLGGRVGVASGLAATVEAPDEGLVVGDVVNLASRIQTVADTGSCFVDETTRRLAARAMAFEGTGTHDLKGVADPVPIFRALRVLAGVGGRQHSASAEVPLVGRDVELRMIKDFFHATVDGRTPSLLLVSGAAGVGKSRLGLEFEKYVDGLVDRVLWHRGRCLSYGEGVTFWALAEMLRQRLSIAEDDPTETAATRLSEGLVRWVPEADRAYVAVRIARLLGVESPEARATVLPRDELFAGWRLFFERLAAIAPVVMVVEDGEHADKGLVEFLHHLIDWTRGLPIFVLVLARPELAEAQPSLGMGHHRNLHSLAPLDGSSIDDMVSSLVPGIPARARTAIAARARGIPLFALETVRSMIDAGIVAGGGRGGYRLVGDLDSLNVPESLLGLLASRLDALDASTRHLVGAAAVLGTTFSAEALTTVSNREPSQVHAGLAELVHRDVLEVNTDPLSPERGDYRFSHELLRQVAYDRLARRERKVRHLAVAAHLRGTFSNDADEVSELVARHYLDALAAAPDDTDAPSIRDEAITMLVRAGVRAAASGAPARAAASYAAAARLTIETTGAATDARPDAERMQQAAALYERANRQATHAGDYEPARSHGEAARACHEWVGDARGAARARALSARALRHSGRFAEARVELEEALSVLQETPDADTVEALSSLINIELYVGNLADADRLSAQALDLGRVLRVDDAQMARLHISRGIVDDHANHTTEGAFHFREGARLAEGAGDGDLLTHALINLSDVLGRFDPAGAVDAASAAVAHARRVGVRDRLGFATANLAVALLELGEWDQAADVLDYAAGGDGLDEHQQVVYLAGLLAALRGELERADDALAVLEPLSTSEDVQTRAIVGLVAAHTAAARDDRRAGLAFARSVVERAGALGIHHEAVRWAWPLAARLASELDERDTVEELLALLDDRSQDDVPSILAAERALARARAAASLGDPGATAAFSDAVTALRSAPNPYSLGGGLLDLAQHLAREGEQSAAEETLEEAREIARRLRCQPFLRRADVLTQWLSTRA